MLRSLLLLLLFPLFSWGYYPTFPQHPGDVVDCETRWSSWVQTWYFSDCEDDNNSNEWFGAIPKGNYTENIAQNFCTGSLSTVPVGSYCFLVNFREMGCPNGFTEGIRAEDQEDDNNGSEGGGPFVDRPRLSGEGGNVPWWHYCCGSGDPQIPISFDAIRDELPNRFILFQLGSACQLINGRTVSTGWTKWDDEDDNNRNGVEGLLPFGAYGRDTLINYCTYSPSVLPYPAATITLNSLSSTTATITWTTDSSATRYQYELLKNGDVVASQTSLTALSVSLPDLVANSAYTLRVFSGIATGPAYETVGKDLQFTTCLAGYTGLTCQPICDQTCVFGSCTAPNTCTCNSGWNGTACSECPSGHYHTSPSTCASCPNCNHGTCSDGATGTGECICSTGYQGTYCDACKPGFYNDGGLCFACDITCETCQHNSSYCLSCPESLVLQPNHTCTPACSPGYFLSEEVCVQCDPACDTCFGSGSGSCDTCAAGKVQDGASCLASCPTGKYNSSQAQCVVCATVCSSCDGPGGSACLACSANHFLKESSCLTLTECTTNHSYVLGSDCLGCNSSCKTCHGPEAQDCLTCDVGLLYYEGQCVAHCPNGTYENDDQCADCVHPCGSCLFGSPRDCLSCVAPLYLQDTVCVEECPTGWITLNSTNECARCSTRCATCSGTSSDSCLSCVRPFFLQDTQCVDACYSTLLPNSDGVCAAASSLLSPVEQWLPIGFYFAIGIVCLILYYFARRKNPRAKNALIIFTGISLVEFATDAIFLSVTFRLTDKAIFYSSLFFTLFPAMLNTGLVTYVLLREIKKQAGKGDYLVKHSAVASGVALISMKNVALLRLLDSKIFDLEAFSMDWDAGTHLQGRVFGLVSDVLDNIPQIIIQGFYLSLLGADPVGVASIVASSLSLLFGVVHKLLLLMVLRFDPPAKRVSSSITLKEKPSSQEMTF